MRKMTQKDVAAISHAEQYIWPTIKPSMPARQRQEIEDDLERLAQIKRWLLGAIYSPGLPLVNEIPEIEVTDGYTTKNPDPGG